MEEYKLRDYVPKIYEDVLEMDELIEVEQNLFDEAIDNANQVIDNAFIITSDTTRIRDYEKLLNIKANPATEDLQFRRERVLNRMSTKPPFTMKWLKEKLDTFIGEDNYRMTYTPNEYFIYIKVREMSSNWENELRTLLDMTLPANMIYQLVENPYTTYGELASMNYTYGQLEPYTHEEIKTL